MTVWPSFSNRRNFRRGCPRGSSLRLLLVTLVATLNLPAADLETQAREILERRCLACHDSKLRTAGLDLSTRESALRGGGKGPAVAPGASAQSLLFNRVRKNEMPPAAPLPAAEQDILRRWIDAGVPWQGRLEPRRAGLDWWALQPLNSRQAPASHGLPAAWQHSPIDRWIGATLLDNGLSPAPPAARRTIIRRATFSLTGLPPSPEEIDAFVHDPQAGAYDRLIDRLLASPHYGERWARHWLDVVRFAESEGFERDWLRENAWGYRDYVIRSFNQDTPYTRFAQEQIAGDVLEPVTHDGILASSMLVLGPTDAVGLTSAVPRERAAVREDQLEEMLAAVGQTWLGLTVNCARCHDHKFDPIPQKDYYRLKAVFEGVWQPTRGDELKAEGRPLLTPAEIAARNQRLEPIRTRIAELEASIGSLYRTARQQALGAQPAGRLPSPLARWTFDADARDDFGPLHAQQTDAAEVAGGRLRPASGKEAVTLSTPPLAGDLREKTLEAWIYVRKLPGKAVTVLRIRNRSGFRGAAFDGIQYAAGKNTQWENFSTVSFRTADAGGPPEDSTEGVRIHIAIVYSGDDTITLYRNGRPYGKGYRPDTGVPAGRLQTYLRNDAIVELSASQDLELEEARIYTVALTADQIAASHAAGAASLTPDDLRRAMSEAEQIRLGGLHAQLAAARHELKDISEPERTFAAEARDPGPTHLLIRGDVNHPGERVAPGALSFISGLPAELGLSPDASDAERRGKLAAWVTSPANPLFSRVMVNRVWSYHFGAGLVENPNDFGFNGGRPSHPELLDWLAAEFIRGGWSVKKLHKLILASQAYRQASRFDAAAAAKDAGNRLLWRYPSRRLEGEAVRDAMLAASGSLNSKMYGPSFRPFQMVKNSGSYHSYDPVDSDDPELQRRTIYRMNVNSGGNPMLESLDCPVPSIKTPKRSTTTTPLQALSLMNNAFVNRQAKAFAGRLAREGADPSARIDRAFLLALGRAPQPSERSSALDLIGRHGLETFCWGLLNSSEFLYVE